MKVGWLGGCLLVMLAGCRQPNPEWQGPADGSASSTVTMGTTTGPEPASTSGSTSTSGSSGIVDSSGSTTSVGGSTGVETEGLDCNNDGQCPEDLVCGPVGCQQGKGGDPCTGNADCQAPTALCGPLEICQAGAAGDPCGGNVDCDGLSCTDSVCG